MAANLSKKFALLCCCLMTMQALRLVISTAGFCALRFHIDCTLFNIFISRLVNAVMMSQLFGNWLGDLIVFVLDGQQKLYSLALANWTELICFCTALYCIVHTEVGHLTGFYWSMVLAYFWWKVSEAPTVSIAAPDATDYYYAGFTLSGVWAAILKGLVMRCVSDGTKTQHFHSDALGEVNVSVIGTRSVKTTVDYRAAKWLYIITILLTALMCLTWTEVAEAVKDDWDAVRQEVIYVLEEKKTEVVAAINGADGSGVESVTKVTATEGDNNKEKININTSGGNVSGLNGKTLKEKVDEIDGAKGMIGEDATVATNKITVSVNKAGVLDADASKASVALSAICFGGVLAVPGAMLGAGFVRVLEWLKEGPSSRVTLLIWGIVGALGGMAAGAAPCVATDWESGVSRWVEDMKWPAASGDWQIKWAPMMGLGVGLATGALLGLLIGAIVGCVKGGICKRILSGLFAGALVGSFAGLISGEIANGVLRPDAWKKDATDIVVCGYFIVVLGLGTVYSIYPGMAPCSITQFQYFNIIDILILILSAIAPIVVMGLDLANKDDKLGNTILKGSGLAGQNTKWVWTGFGLFLLIATLTCEIIVLCIMQQPFSKLAQKVTTSGWRAVTLTVTMVTSQLTSSTIGFGCVAAGSGFNDGVNNVLSTLVLWTIECCGVLGEGYLTELKKYEPGKWPTQGKGGWDSYWWWNKKAFGNAWQIWCCIGTKDLRRDIMLCKQ